MELSIFMLPAQFWLGPINIFPFGVSLALAFVVASFLLWRDLREDYLEEEIITFIILVTLFGLFFGRIFYLAGHFSDFNFSLFKWVFWARFPGFSLPGAFLGGTIFSLYWSKKKNWDFWLVADSLVPAFLAALLVGSLGAFLASGEIGILFKCLLAILVFLASFYLRQNFRKFIWYKSGRPGFVASSLTTLYFLGFAALDFWAKTNLYWDLGVTLMVVVLALVFLYRRSGRVLTEDLALLGQAFRREKQ